MKIEAHIVRKESVDMTNYFLGSKLKLLCLKCRRKFAFQFYNLPSDIIGISGQPIAIKSFSVFPFLHFCNDNNDISDIRLYKKSKKSIMNFVNDESMLN